MSAEADSTVAKEEAVEGFLVEVVRHEVSGERINK